MQIEFKYTPFPAVRSNRNSWNIRTQEYHSKMNALRTILMPHIEEIISAMIDNRYSITFVLPMPVSWSFNKKEEMRGEFHKAPGDIDNFFKAFTDTVFYLQKNNDKEVSTCYCSKIWGDEGNIIFNSIE